MSKALPTSLLVAALAVSTARAECANVLKLRGVGEVVAHRVQPYVACVNSTVGPPEKIRSLCSEARAKATNNQVDKVEVGKLTRAITWLDAMIEERNTCETRLDVGA